MPFLPRNYSDPLIANLQINCPLAERKGVFPENCIRTAERFDQVFLRTEQLYEAICAKQGGTFDEKRWWSELHAMEGPGE